MPRNLTSTRAVDANKPTRRFLIVEDNDDAREMLQALLEAAGHRAVAACDGVEALDIVAHTEFDVVLCDIGLPRMNGYEFAEAVTGAPEFADLRLVALSGYAQDLDRTKSAKAGFDAHLAKPVSLNDIEEVVTRLLAENSEASEAQIKRVP